MLIKCEMRFADLKIVVEMRVHFVSGCGTRVSMSLEIFFGVKALLFCLLFDLCSCSYMVFRVLFSLFLRDVLCWHA